MRILIVADAYPPEVSSAAHLMRELAEGLEQRGHQVIVATTQPRHYLDEQSKDKKYATITLEQGVSVLRIKTPPLKKVNFIRRGITQLFLPFIFFSKIKQHISGDVDAVIVYSPPLTLGITGALVKKHFKAKFLLNLQDIFPQNAIDLGVLKNKPAIWLFERIEQYVYKHADLITFHSDKGRDFLVHEKGVQEDKINTLPNWIDPSPYEQTYDSSFLKQYGIQNKLVFLFAGIMGPAQGLGFLIDVAEQVRDLTNVLFLLVGDGSEKEKIEKQVAEKNLTNVMFQPFVSGEQYPALVQETDVGVVCLSPANKTPFIPGKFLGYMAAGKPILAFLHPASDGFDLVQDANCGQATVAGDLKKAEEAVRFLATHKEKLSTWGGHGRTHLKKYQTLDAALDTIENLLTSEPRV